MKKIIKKFTNQKIEKVQTLKIKGGFDKDGNRIVGEQAR